MAKEDLITLIESTIVENHSGNIDAELLQGVLKTMVTGLSGEVIIEEHESTDTTIESLTPNVFHKWNDPITSLHIQELTPGADFLYTEYMLRFRTDPSWSQSTNPFPQDILWVTDPDIQGNQFVLVSIVDNIGVMATVDIQ